LFIKVPVKKKGESFLFSHKEMQCAGVVVTVFGSALVRFENKRNNACLYKEQQSLPDLIGMFSAVSWR
jgi:hypothetical protein